jgi:hypothetical protein
MNDDVKFKPGDLYSRGKLSFVLIVATKVATDRDDEGDGLGNTLTTLDNVDGLETVWNVKSVTMLVKYGSWKCVSNL